MSSDEFVSCETNVAQMPDSNHPYSLQNMNKQLLSVTYLKSQSTPSIDHFGGSDKRFALRMSSLSEIGICGNANTYLTKTGSSGQSQLLQRLTTGLLTTKILKYTVTDNILRMKINLTDYNDAKVINQTNVGI